MALLRIMATAMLFLWAATGRAAQPIEVVTTFSILGDMTSRVGGDLVQVVNLVGPGGDVHVYQPKPSDAKTLAQAKLVISNGLGMEGWLDRLIAASGYKGPVVAASTGVRSQTMREAGGSGKEGEVADPHAWQDLANGRVYVRNIAEALAQADPANADGYRRRAADYDRELAELDAWTRQHIAEVPAAKRKLITSHDAFGYFGRAYGISLLAPLGLSTESEPSPAALGKLVRQMKTTGIKAVFLENMTDPRLITQLAREGGAVIGGTLYSDSLSPEDGPAPTYVAMFRHNVTTMVTAMQRN